MEVVVCVTRCWLFEVSRRGGHPLRVRTAPSRPLTLREGDDVQNKIDAKSAAGLDKSIVIMRGRNDFDRLLDDLAATHASQNYRLAEKVMPLVGRAIL